MVNGPGFCSLVRKKWNLDSDDGYKYYWAGKCIRGDLMVIQTSSTKEYNKSTSHVISANIPNIQITNLNEPVTVSFSSVYQNQQCAYWDESSDQKPRWSTNGCKTSTYVPGEKVVCSCNHLTSFTLLVGNNMTSHNYQ
ncbi:G-protein coupled receptor 126-like [Octopus vulgaris]|uniref:G-protein coupled receptor 126-like n=1 Tax=Octopus vulgaris TaxID=6645 RepID=A0AA36ALG5_OCTVU|nr:G-protein coupled receptor 126-like [Octopus vulgaris]